MKYFVFAISLLFTCAPCHAGSGYLWGKTPVKTKELLIQQYVSGYKAGFEAGISEGITATSNALKSTETNSNDSTTTNYDSCSNKIARNVDKIYDSSSGWQNIPDYSTEYYMQDIDKFLKEYPGCQKLDVSTIIEMLLPVWFNMNPAKINYQTIGEECSNNK
jgi:hypothetical protein